jgi:hypothetical protein
MSRAKAFWVGFGISLAVVVPLYLAAAAYSFVSSAPVTTSQSGVPIVTAVADDARTLLVMTGAQQPDSFVLVRLDAYHGIVSTAAIPAELTVQCSGQTATLEAMAQRAGPAQAAAALRETLEIPIHQYLYCTGDTLAALCADFPSVRMDLSRYLSDDALAAVQLNLEGVEQLTLTPSMLYGALQQGAKTPALQLCLRADGYLAFAQAAAEQVPDTFLDALRGVVSGASTNFTATDIYSYQRIFKFLQRQTPTMVSVALPTQTDADTAQLVPTEAAYTLMQQYFKGTS